MTIQQQLNLIWRNTHPDFKGMPGGKRAILIFVENVGTCLVPLDALTAEQIAAKLERRGLK